ncbi:Exosome complex component CSL4 [Choanephora cucurbitarum]|uniref:Exosome complex component CSL4 n=1 Tax=Choanephora cucurbitarum TaxID=101091 RepID=A0A1C7NNI7_9FUNG|nr:Exosome complex component CSL4 [Choanephora cucurbitarum]
MSNKAEAVTPGQRLGYAADYIQGTGTYERDGLLYASVVGQRYIDPSSQEGGLPTMRVSREKEQSAVPEVGSVITGKVIRVSPHQAVIAIMVVGDMTCKEDFMGIIRTQDVRAAEKDKVKIYNSFRPGDIVKAEVISLGDARSYVLSTAKNELGVIFATSVAGATMIPISWQEMQCPKTKSIELRKCAKPSA